MQYSIFDIPLSLFEQTLEDDVLRPFVVDRATETSDKARAAIRANSGTESTVFIYRLPVMHDWQNFSTSLTACVETLKSKAIPNGLNAQIVIWSDNFEIKYKIISDPNNEFKQTAPNLDEIRQTEFSDFLKMEGVFLEHSGDALFELPSKQYSDYFLRIGNLQSKQSFLYAVFFWSVENLQNTRHVFCDTWSISTSCAIIAEFLNLYRRTIEPAHKSRSASWSFSPSYLPNSQAAKRLLLEAKNLADQKGGSLLVISSFYSSGSLERSIIDTLKKDENDKNTQLIAIYNAGSEFQKSDLLMCNVQPLIEAKGLKGKIAERFPTSELLYVNPLTFFPDYRVPEVLKFKWADILEYKSFFDSYKSSGIFSVHRDGQNFGFQSRDGVGYTSRHHAFHVDAEALFEHATFQEKLTTALENCTAAFDCILYDESKASISLIEAISKIRPDIVGTSNRICVSDWRLLEAEDDFLDISNREGGRTLILIPTVISGQSLGSLRRQVRRIVPRSRQAGLHFLIGLLRPEGSTEINNYMNVQGYFGDSWSRVIESIVLPDWGKKECPWCREELAIDKILELNRNALYNDDFENLALRLETLRSCRTTGIKNESVFFSSESDPSLPFNPGSLFQEIGPEDEEFQSLGDEISGQDLAKEFIRLASQSDVNEADLCLVTASAMQCWRDRSAQKSLRRPAIDTASIIHPDKFNEARIRASIWRCLLPTEKSVSVRAAEAGDFKDLVIRILGDDYDEHHSCLKFELLLSFPRDVAISDAGISTKETELFLIR